MLNRNVDQPYKYVGTWLIDQWSKIGLKVTQKMVPTGPWFEAMRNGNFDVVVEAPGYPIVNPVMDIQKLMPSSVASEGYARYEDPKTVELYDKLLHESDPARQRAAMRELRKTPARYRGACALGAVVAPHRALPLVCEGAEDRPEPFHQPGSGKVWLDK